MLSKIKTKQTKYISVKGQFLQKSAYFTPSLVLPSECSGEESMVVTPSLRV